MSDHQHPSQLVTVELLYQMIRETTAQVKEMFRETDERFKETAERFKETDKQFKETAERFKETDEKFKETAEQIKKNNEQIKETNARIDQSIQELRRTLKQAHKNTGQITATIGRIVEFMVGGDIINQFCELGYHVTDYERNVCFGFEGKKRIGEIDLLLKNDDVVILIEVKTTLEVKDVRKHIERLQKYRIWLIDQDPANKNLTVIGAVAAASLDEYAVKMALSEGIYVIQQSGKAVEIKPTPEGFKAKHW